LSARKLDRDITKIIKAKFDVLKSWDVRDSLPKKNKKLSFSVKKGEAELAAKTSNGGLNFTSILSQ